MKKFVISCVTIGLLFFLQPQLSFAQMGMMGNYYANGSSSAQADQQKNLANETNTVLNSQNVSAISQLNCSKVSQNQFEKVGDAWMGVMAGNEANHSVMEQRMGGEGSESLKQAHIQMGENYLGCGTRGGGYPMMGWSGYGYGNMMNGGFGWGFGIVAFLFWIVAFIDLILLGIFLWRRIRK